MSTLSKVEPNKSDNIPTSQIQDTKPELLNTPTFSKNTTLPSIIDNEYSSYNVDSFGNVNETFISVNHIPSKIIEITQHFVQMECVIDYETNELDIREIEKGLIPSELLLVNQIICIKISKRPGKFLTEFIDGTGWHFEKYFEFDIDELRKKGL